MDAMTSIIPRDIVDPAISSTATSLATVCSAADTIALAPKTLVEAKKQNDELQVSIAVWQKKFCDGMEQHIESEKQKTLLAEIRMVIAEMKLADKEQHHKIEMNEKEQKHKIEMNEKEQKHKIEMTEIHETFKKDLACKRGCDNAVSQNTRGNKRDRFENDDPVWSVAWCCAICDLRQSIGGAHEADPSELVTPSKSNAKNNKSKDPVKGWRRAKKLEAKLNAEKDDSGSETEGYKDLQDGPTTANIELKANKYGKEYVDLNPTYIAPPVTTTPPPVDSTRPPGYTATSPNSLLYTVCGVGTLIVEVQVAVKSKGGRPIGPMPLSYVGTTTEWRALTIEKRMGISKKLKRFRGAKSFSSAVLPSKAAVASMPSRATPPRL
jgi:hypothetical protein